MSFHSSLAAAAAATGSASSYPTSTAGGASTGPAMADRMRFSDLCNLLDTISDKKGAAKREYLKDFFNRWRKQASRDPIVSRGRE